MLILIQYTMIRLCSCVETSVAAIEQWMATNRPKLDVDKQTVVNCRFRRLWCQLMEEVLWDMPVHLLGTLFWAFLNAAHKLSLRLLSDAISSI